MSRYTNAEWQAIYAARKELNPCWSEELRKVTHTPYVCDGQGDRCKYGTCMFCDGGLFACDVCGSFDGYSTTDCPGRKIHDIDAVYAGRLDYRAGTWVAGPSLYTPALFVLACERAGVKP
jgi:hypothetical protein